MKPGSMIQIVYASEQRGRFTPLDLDLLLRKARIRNTTHAVSGMLLYHSGSFLQVLEGAEASVRLIFESIARDPRHRSIREVSRKSVAHREFEDWSMGFIDSSEWPTAATGKFDYRREAPGLIAAPTAARSYLRLFHQGLLRQAASASL